MYVPNRFTNISYQEFIEAAVREGMAFLSTVKDRDGREKVVLMSAPPKAIEYFLANPMGSGETYGSPARGYAGVYIS